MKYQTKIACSVLAISMLCASTNVFAAATLDSGEALLELLSAKGVITREEAIKLREKSTTPAGGSLDAVIELLQLKGTISREEAEMVRKKSVDTVKNEQSEKVEETPKGTGKEAVAELNVILPEKEIRPVIDVLREQGVLGSEESEQIKERYGKKWSTVEGDDFIAMEDQEIEYSRTTLPKEGILANISKLQHQGLIDAEESERIRSRFLQKLALERVTDSIGENVQRDMRTEIASKILPIPEWTQRIKLKGDLRLRYRADLFDKNNSTQIPKPDLFQSFPTSTSSFMNTTVDRYYTQVRARLGLTAKVNDQMEAGIGLATGNTSNPVSTNTTLGDSLNKKNFLLDQAYLRWTPYPEFTVMGGRFENPWFGTDLVWDPDVNFDGLAMSWKPDFGDGLSMFVTVGAFPLEEVELSSRDKWLYGGQVGLNYKYRDSWSATLAAAYYHFDHITGRGTTTADFQGATDWTRPKFLQKGNTLFYLDEVFRNPNEGYLGLAAAFRELNISTKIDYSIDENHRVTLIGDYVNNLGYSAADVNARVGFPMVKDTEGFLVGLSVGTKEIKSAWDWKASLNYKFLEADAVVDGFTESDFHLGGTNAKGWILGVDLGLAKNVWLNTRWFTANEIDGPPLAIDVFQLNLNARF